MIRIPLDQHTVTTTTTHLNVSVEVYEDSGTVEISLECEPGEMVPWIRKVDDPEHAAGDPDDLRGQLRVARAERDALSEAIGKLRDMRDVDRHLLPSEARALAAALVHFAAEADR